MVTNIVNIVFPESEYFNHILITILVAFSLGRWKVDLI